MKLWTVIPVAGCVLLAACEGTPVALEPNAVRAAAPAPAFAAAGGPSLAGTPTEPIKPNFNLEVILRPPEGQDGFGHVKFRQDNDDATIVDLGVWVRDLAPNTHYRFQRAVDGVVDGNCTSTAWLTIGKGATPQDIVTDDRGTGNEDLFRMVSSPPGTPFDAHIRIVTTATPPVVVLASECFQFFVR